MDRQSNTEETDSHNFLVVVMSTSLESCGIPAFISNGTKPDPSTIDKAYLAMLEAQLVPPNVRGNLASKLGTDSKWDQIVAYQSMIGNAEMSQNAAFGDADRLLLSSLKMSKRRPDITKVLKLKSRISTCNKFWMDAFIEAQGINILTYAMETRLAKVPLGELDAAILFELICCVKAIINSGAAMKRFLNTGGALRTVTYAMLFEWKPLVLQVLEVLSVVCDYSNEAAEQIVKHLRHLARLRREAPFALFAHALIDADVDVKAAVMQLINNLLAGTDKLSDRMVMRNELKALRFSKICELAADDLNDELEDIKNLVPRHRPQFKHAGSDVSTHGRITDFLTRDGMGYPQEGDLSMRPSEGAQAARKERMRARHPSERNFPYLFTPSDLQKVADDKKTLIDPEVGIMGGSLIAGKNRGVTKGLLKDFGSKATKTRFYYLDGTVFSWWAVEEDHTRAQPHGSIIGTEIQDVRPYSANEDLYALSEYTFEIVTSSRVHSFACDSDEAKDDWLVALNAVRDKALLAKWSYSFLSNELDSQEFANHAEMFRKQIIVFEAIGSEDYQRSITKSGVDVSDSVSLASFLNAEMSSAGIGDKLMELLQELIVIPADSEFGVTFWDTVINVCRDMRVLNKPGAATSPSSKLQSYKLDTETTMRLLRKKERTPGGKAAVDLNKLTLDLFTKNAEIDRLNAEIQSLRSGGSPRSTSGQDFSGGSTRVRSARITMPAAIPGDSQTSKVRISTPTMDQVIEGSGDGGEVTTTSAAVAANLELPPKLPPKPPPRSRPSSYTESSPGTTEPTPTSTPVTTPTPQDDDGRIGTTDKKPPVEGKVQASANLAALFGAPKSQRMLPPTVTGEPKGESVCGDGVEAKPNPGAALSALFAAKSQPPGNAKSCGSRLPSFGAEGVLLGSDDNATGVSGANVSVGGASSGSHCGTKKAVSGPPLAVPASDQPIPRPPPLPDDAAVYLGAAAVSNGESGGPPVPNMAALLKGGKKKNADVPESKHKPGKKMKGLFWTAIKPDASKSCNSLWSKVDLKKLDDLELDYSELEDCFSQSESSSRPAVNVKTKARDVSVLDMTRTQNVEISSRGLNRTPNGLVQLVLELNPVELTLEATEICLSLVPTPSDISAIRGHHGPDAELGKAGQLLKALIDVPRLKERLECHKIIFSWNKTMDSVRAGNQMLDRACGELLSAASTAKLSKLLSVILAVGNFMNGGSSRVAAAVKLDSLLKLSTVKAANGQRGTLLHFVIKQLQNKFPDVLDFYMDWTCVTAASGISLTLLLSDKKCLMVDIDRLKMELKMLSSLKNVSNPDVITLAEARFGPFIEMATEQLEQIVQAVNATSSRLESTAAAFGECIDVAQAARGGDDMGSDQTQKFFSLLNEVVITFKKAVDELEQWRVEELKAVEVAQQRAVRRASIAAAKAEASPEDDVGGERKSDVEAQDNLFGRFRNQQNASPDDIISQLKAKMKLKQMRAEED